MELDPDTFSILFEYVCDDVNFLLYMKMNNVKPRNREVDYDAVNWYDVSGDEELSFEVMEAFPDKLNWFLISQTYKYKCTEDNFEFFDRMDNYVDWNLISSKMRLGIDDDYEFYERYAERLTWDKISRYSGMTEDFIAKFADNLNWTIMSKCQGLTPYLFETFSDKIDYSQLKYNNVIPQSLKTRYMPDVEGDEEETESDTD